MAETPQERISCCYYCETYEYKILGNGKRLLHDGPLLKEDGFFWRIEFEEDAVTEKYKQPTIVMIPERRLLEVRYFDKNAVSLQDSNLRNHDYDPAEAHRRCSEALDDGGWTFLSSQTSL